MKSKIFYLLIAAILVIFIKAPYATTYYVSTTGNDASAGTSETSAWRHINYAAGKVVAGDKVYIEAGNYGNEQVIVSNNGTATNRIVFEGYRTTPGDNPQVSYTLGDVLDPTDMPLLDGGNRASAGTGINLDGQRYVTVKNVQIKNYVVGMSCWGSRCLTVQNIIATAFGDIASDYSGKGIVFGSEAYGDTARNCIIVNAGAEGMTVSGDSNYIENVKVYCNENAGNGSTDYYLIVAGNDNTITRCYAERVGSLTHGGHGIGVKTTCLRNVFTHNVVKNFRGEGFYVRHRGCLYNVFEYDTAYGGNGITVRDGGSWNTFRNCRIYDASTAVSFWDCTEDNGATYCGRHNTFINCLFTGTQGTVIDFNSYDMESPADSNTFTNCIFYGGDYLFSCRRTNNANIMENSIVAGVANHKTGTFALNFTFKYCDFWNNGFSAPAGGGIITSNPLFADTATEDFHLKSAYGRWNPVTKAWVMDATTSPAIDAGDPASPYSNEPAGNGGRVNLGIHGNTLYASKSSLPTTTRNQPDVLQPRYGAGIAPKVYTRYFDLNGKQLTASNGHSIAIARRTDGKCLVILKK